MLMFFAGNMHVFRRHYLQVGLEHTSSKLQSWSKVNRFFLCDKNFQKTDHQLNLTLTEIWRVPCGEIYLGAFAFMALQKKILYSPITTFYIRV